MKPEIVMPTAILTGVDEDDYVTACERDAACLSRWEPDFEPWLEAISEGRCPACLGPLASICSILTREEWLICPQGRWLRLVWST
jgi:hypothetical protein